MATAHKCPSCGHLLALPGSMVGPVTCTACGKTFDVPIAAPAARSGAGKSGTSKSGPTKSGAGKSAPTKSGTVKSGVSKDSSLNRPAQVAVAAPEPARTSTATIARATVAVSRRPGSRPELLDRLPKSFLNSPPAIAGGGVVVVLYGMVLLGIVTAWKNRPDLERPRPAIHETVTFGPTAATPTVEPVKPSPEAAATKPVEKSASTEEQKKETKDKTASKDKPAKEEKPATSAPAVASTKNNSPAPKTEVAIVTPPPTLTPVSAVPRPEHWGILSGFPGDCHFEVDGAGLTIGVPGTLHIFSTGLEIKPPQLLTDAGGDFTAKVQVVGSISSGVVPLDVPQDGPKPKDQKVNPKFPFTFQGAGLIVIQDETNFIRLERTALFTIEDSKRDHVVLVEYYKNGKLISDHKKRLKSLNADLTLKLERKGTVIRCSYSPDNSKTWVEVKRLEKVALPATVKVGVSASNISAKPFNARFENFDLTAGTQ